MTGEKPPTREIRARCNEALHRKIAEAAKQAMRSMSAEIVFRLKDSIASDEAERAA